jgi:hypothetical protein
VAYSKYEPITDYFLRQDNQRAFARLSFERIEQIIGAPLAPTARSDRTWWGNTMNRTRVQAHSWLNAGWMVDKVDFEAGAVEFVRGVPDFKVG